MFPCHKLTPLPQSRRAFLRQAGCGFGAVALAALWAQGEIAGSESTVASTDPLAPRQPHFKARAKNVIFLYMDGGPSQVDTFDPKPRLNKEHGQPFAVKIEPTQFNNNGNTFGCPWKFQQYGQSGIPVSDLFPNVAKHVDKLAVIRSMTSQFPEHTSANFFLHTGTGVQGRPSMGAWFGYGLGSECRDLPGFIVINGGRGTRPVLGRASLNFDKDQTITISKNEIHFTSRRPVIGNEEFQAGFAEVLFGCFLAKHTVAQVDGQR